jgi:protein TonB
MPRDLFGHVTHPSISVGTRKWYTVPVSLLSHAAIVLVLIAIPILAPAVMPSVLADGDPAWINIEFPKTPPPPPTRRDAEPIKPTDNSNAAPVTAPTGVHEEQPQPAYRDPTGPDIVIGDATTFTRELAPPPAVAAPQQAVRAGGAVRTPQKTNDVNPVYPAIAQAARVQGIVIIEATIGEDGRVTNARILRSVPLLDQAAIDAVRQWQYTPTLLNGVPVPVIMTVTVNFTLR